MTTYRSEILSALRWVAGARLLGQLITWGITIAVMRILTPSDYGILAMATILVAFLSMMAQFGVGAAAIQVSEIDDAKLRTIFGLVILTNVTLFAAVFSAAPLVARFFDEPRLTLIVRTLGVQFILMIFTVIPSSLLSRRLQFRGQSLVDLSGALASSLTALAGALAGLGVWALVWASLVLEAWRVVGLNIIAPFWHRPDFRLQGAKQYLWFGGNITASRILWFFYSQADIVIAGKFLGKDALGIYSVSLHVASLPVQKLSAIINQVAFPAFARIQDDHERFNANFLLAIRMLSFVAFPVLWGMSSMAPELVGLLLGQKWEDAALPLQLLTLIMPLHMLAPFINTAAQGLGRADIAMQQVLLAALIMPVAFLVGVQWGMVGLSIAWVVAFPIVLWGSLLIFLPVIGLRIGDVLQAIARPLLAGLGMYATVALVRSTLDPQMQLAVQLTILLLTGALAFCLSALTLNRAGCREIVGLLKGA